MNTATFGTAEFVSNAYDTSNFEKLGRLLLPARVVLEQRAIRDGNHFDKDAAALGTDQDDPLAESIGRRWKKSKANEMPEWEEPLSSHRGPVIRIIRQEEIDEYAAVLTSQPHDDNYHKSIAMLRALMPLGELRKLYRRPLEWKAKLNRLEARFPHFAELLQHVRACCALSERADLDTITLDNIILCGPPGLGKTYFAEFLAQFLRDEAATKKTLTIRMADQQSNSAIAGSDSFWSNSKPSLIFEELILKEYGNPIIVLDELDKASGDNRFDPISPLYTLWEKASAENWKDLSFPWVTIDASRITWIATCNTTRTLPEPILSRAQVFNIVAPTEDEAIGVAEIIAWESLQEYLPGDPVEFSDGAIKALSMLSPRRQRAAIKSALGTVALRQGDVVYAADIPGAASSASIGFI